MSEIEDTIQPETINEVLLVNRIRKLNLLLWQKGLDTPSFREMATEFTMEKIDHPTVHLAAQLDAGWEEDDRFHVVAKSRNGLHYAYYMSREVMTRWTKQAAAESFIDMHKKMLLDLADEVSK